MNKVWLALMAIVGFVVAILRGNAYKAKAKQASAKAEQAQAASDNLQGINTALNELEQQHQQEDRNAEDDRLHDRRDGLDNRW